MRNRRKARLLLFFQRHSQILFGGCGQSPRFCIFGLGEKGVFGKNGGATTTPPYVPSAKNKKRGRYALLSQGF